jgi:hypothetical protein
MFETEDSLLVRQQMQGILVATLMYRLGINEITIGADDVDAVAHTFGGPIMDLMVKVDPLKKEVSFKIEACK